MAGALLSAKCFSFWGENHCERVTQFWTSPSEEEEEEERRKKKENHYCCLAIFRFSTFLTLFHATRLIHLRDFERVFFVYILYILHVHSYMKEIGFNYVEALKVLYAVASAKSACCSCDIIHHWADITISKVRIYYHY